MPIGVPKVPFRLPGEEDAVRIDVNRLYRERLLFLGQQVDDEIANQPIGIMMYLNGEDETKDTYLYTNFPGGAVLSGISVYDATQFVVPDAHTICMGLAASMGSSISTGGEITKRIALPHARVMIHQPASSHYDGQAGECIMEAEEVSKPCDCITRVHVQRTGKPLWMISEDMERDVFTSAKEAENHGIVDPVASENSPDSRLI
uniref:ATP-dependent Clp protease proteolytic subunit n=1 Tax=Dipteris conjugata TaxID=32108 RepID=A0A385GPB5_9MONI|nr:clp protease proteolytic subunit [Dipteris conjugata]